MSMSTELFSSHIRVVTGGARSGKSTYARTRAEHEHGALHIFLATAPVIDAEMSERVERHREERRGSVWRTIEEEVALTEALCEVPSQSVILLDCLTLWLSNVLYHDASLEPSVIQSRLMAFVAFCREQDHTLYVVTNEIGMGVIPETPLGRMFRDVQGWCNQQLTACADEVTLMVSGLPLTIKAA